MPVYRTRQAAAAFMKVGCELVVMEDSQTGHLLHGLLKGRLILCRRPCRVTAVMSRAPSLETLEVPHL